MRLKSSKLIEQRTWLLRLWTETNVENSLYPNRNVKINIRIHKIEHFDSRNRREIIFSIEKLAPTFRPTRNMDLHKLKYKRVTYFNFFSHISFRLKKLLKFRDSYKICDRIWNIVFSRRKSRTDTFEKLHKLESASRLFQAVNEIK